MSAVAASLGCGNPIAVAELRQGEKVLDLGSGGGIDVLLSARRVGETGFAYGVDMTDEMLDLARANAAQAGATNVEFLKGTIEDIPLPDGSVDVVISNCVINLSVDKPKVITEMFRVLSPGGRIGISDVVAEDHLSIEARAERGSYVGCIAGALSRQEYLDGLTSAGFTNATVRFTHQTADGMHSAIIQATKPEGLSLIDSQLITGAGVHMVVAGQAVLAAGRLFTEGSGFHDRGLRPTGRVLSRCRENLTVFSQARFSTLPWAHRSAFIRPESIPTRPTVTTEHFDLSRVPPTISRIRCPTQTREYPTTGHAAAAPGGWLDAARTAKLRRLG